MRLPVSSIHGACFRPLHGVQLKSVYRIAQRHYHGHSETFVESDIVILRQVTDPSAPPILTRPLSLAVKIETHKGIIRHEDIIGKAVRDVVNSSKGTGYRIHNVSLSEYTRLTKRLVTPIYPADANLIVSLFDLHVAPPEPKGSADGARRLEILEAGTGHGSLTLHLSRAIHAANAPKPSNAGTDIVKPAQADQQYVEQSEDIRPSVDDTEVIKDQQDQWKQERAAVLHTIDVSQKYSKHAEKIVRGFRHGLYAGNVDFHVGDVSDWVHGQLSARKEADARDEPQPFLSHAFLDLPSTHDHIATVASALHVDGTLIVFNPSITQIGECIRRIKQEGIPLFMDQVLELGTNGTGGGREWDVRAVMPRAKAQSLRNETGEPETAAELPGSPASADSASDVDSPLKGSGNEKQEWNMICRPKVGERIVGGGFLGVFKKTRAQNIA